MAAATPDTMGDKGTLLFFRTEIIQTTKTINTDNNANFNVLAINF